ncbi:MAG: MOSC N-terminal beta barrel domain-containing protein [Alcaligenes faecalis]|uniref:MOSC N-terminal beta barrel domain-containing protein n=1 Tax=Alcaligenes TaxID=507 RepID=UPI001E49ACFE|nr:MOSC N-terminal beta barrel domain-containing protein [Alcaligenes sp. MMA]MCC9164246.1 MOSC N-terminal beta barrel domain-containing protein [Alcaligenes sp. MMA]MCH4225599.1 MOSC N-terminal beta barrel domain-containing protein [Alcaligenes faecalis]
MSARDVVSLPQETVCLLQGGPALSGSKALACKGRWVLGDDQGQVLAADALPALAGLSVELRFGQLVLRAPGMLRLEIEVDVIEDDPDSFSLWQENGQPVQLVDEGDLPAHWFSRYTGQPLRLLKRLSQTTKPPAL